MECTSPLKDLIPAYALDTLEAAEVQAVNQHLTHCTTCQADYRAYLSVTADLALALPHRAPPAELRARLMAQIIDKPGKPAPSSVLLVAWDALLRIFRQPAYGVFSLALIFVLGFSNLVLLSQLNSAQKSAANAFSLISLSATDNAPGATGMLVVSQDGEYGTLVVDALPPLNKDQQYQLWLIRNGQRTSGGVFSVSEHGYGALEVSAPEPLINYPNCGVTVEPAGGSPAPTGPRVLAKEP